jgi:hypothetical protein
MYGTRVRVTHNMFLGHVIGAEGLSMQQDKVAAVMEWPTLST